MTLSPGGQLGVGRWGWRRSFRLMRAIAIVPAGRGRAAGRTRGSRTLMLLELAQAAADDPRAGERGRRSIMARAPHGMAAGCPSVRTARMNLSQAELYRTVFSVAAGSGGRPCIWSDNWLPIA